MPLLDTLLPYCQDIKFQDAPAVAVDRTISGYYTTIRTGPKLWTIKLKIYFPAIKWNTAAGRSIWNQLRQYNIQSTFRFDVINGPATLKAPLTFLGNLSAVEQAAVTTDVSVYGDASTVIRLKGLPASRSSCFFDGDFIKFGNNPPYTVVGNVNSSATGTAAVTVSDIIKTYPPASTATQLGSNVFWQMKLAELEGFGMYDVMTGITSQDTFVLSEDISSY